MSEFELQYAGEWVEPIMRGFRLACCDCGLVHKMDFRIKYGELQYRVFRDGAATRQQRRQKGVKLVKNGAAKRK